MTATPSPKDGSPLSSASRDYRSSQTPSPWPLADSPTLPAPAAAAGSDNGGAVVVARQQAREVGPVSWVFEGSPSSPSSPSGKQRPWWKTRGAKAGFAAGALVLAVFVVLLTLGLLGYLRKVGPFASLINNQTTPSSQVPANPLSTIPLVADPFANPPPAAAAVPTPPTSINVPGVAIPTNQPTLNAVREY
ncbi:unnamed protein product [Discula destructiva]